MLWIKHLQHSLSHYLIWCKPLQPHGDRKKEQWNRFSMQLKLNKFLHVQQTWLLANPLPDLNHINTIMSILITDHFSLVPQNRKRRIMDNFWLHKPVSALLWQKNRKTLHPRGAGVFSVKDVTMWHHAKEKRAEAEIYFFLKNNNLQLLSLSFTDKNVFRWWGLFYNN